MKRGQIWWADLDEPVASEPGYKRPVLIIQSNEFNRSRISTVVVVPLTSNLKLSEAPGNVRLPKVTTGLSKESVANVSQVITIDKSFLVEAVGQLDNLDMHQIEEGVRLVLGL
ncbi:MAG TPA: type II toxin-antitoxin system PemK/MazF family toxin [Candidatus Saccharimonadales bacterium]|nr:type II toxin-antitoxin system PemK/MazF family toxin [Candidatus Saccharimonadales bacterium]